jgi:DeoR/GlpR family transcriptional regulator of sugar metabolism
MADIIPDHRRRQILERLNKHGSVRVSDLAGELVVAEETIRRDLKLLEREGAAIRTHGGAIPTSPTDNGEARPGAGGLFTDLAFGERLSAMAPQKRAIAAEAARLIKTDNVIALDGSTTAWELARILPRHPLTVVTNSLVIINLLASRGDVRIVCTGGRFNPTLQMFEGLLTHEALGRMNIDLAFFSCRGIDPHRGFSDPSEASAAYKRRLIELAETSVVLADHTKFDTRSAVILAGPGEVTRILTDAGVPAANLKPFEKLGVRCIRVPV